MKCLTLLFFLFSINVFAKTNTAKIYKVKSKIKKLSKKEFSNNLRQFLSSGRPTRMVGSLGHKKAILYLKNKIEKLNQNSSGVLSIEQFFPDINYGINLYESDFKKEIEGKYQSKDPIYKKWKAFTNDVTSLIRSMKLVKGNNIIWEKKGTVHPDEVIIIGAHFDTIAHNKETMKVDHNALQPGADDNGSGVVVALALIEALSKMDLPKTIRIIFWDYEELGFLGSRNYIKRHNKKLKKEKIVGYLNLEMLGNDTKKYDSKKKYGNMKVYIRKKGSIGHKDDLALSGMVVKGSKIFQNRVKFEVVANSFNSSDHINFWKEGIPAMTFTQDWENDFNTRYHGENDFFETLNMKTLYGSYQFILGSVLSWLYDL